MHFSSICLSLRTYSSCIGGFHVRSSPPCWWTKTNDLSLAPFVRPPAIVHCSIVICEAKPLTIKTVFLLVSRFEKLSSLRVHDTK